MLCITGCTLNETPEDLMKVPNVSLKQGEVKAKLKEIIPKESTLLGPKNGNKNAIQFIDLDKDNEDEAVIFYTLKSDIFPLRTLILKKNGSSWEKHSEIKGVGYDIDQVFYKDITGNGNLEIIVGFQGGKYLSKGVGVYAYSAEGIKRIFKESYNLLAIGDLDQDKKNELFLVKADREKGEANAQVYKYLDEAISLVDETKMEGYSYYESAIVGKATKDKVGVFVDAGVGAHSAYTDLLVLEQGKLRNIFFDPVKEITDKTFKAHYVQSRDIDNDSIIEIGLLRDATESKDKSFASTPYITSWYKWDGQDGLVLCKESYDDGYANCSFVFPDKWINNNLITIERDDIYSDDDGIYKFSFNIYDQKSKKKYNLFTISSINIEIWKKASNKFKDEGIDYQELTRSMTKVYAVSNFKDNLLPAKYKSIELTFKDIKNHFSIQ